MAATETDLGKRLAAAACAALGGAAPAAAGPTLENWEFDAATLYYREDGGRVSAVEPVLAMKRKFAGERSLSLRFTLDALTGATPNGAVASPAPQTFTRPSGEGSYRVDAGAIPLDDTFHDTRFAFNAAWEQPLRRLWLLTVGTNVSFEFDFVSAAGSLLLSRDFFDRNTRLTAGLSVERDLIDPVGGVPTEFAAMAAAGAPRPRSGTSGSKTVVDALLGLTQTLDARTVAQLNYSLSRSRGYLNDPYKVVSVVDAATGVPARHLYESRPGSRTRHALFGLVRRHLARDIVSGSYRFYLDDWGVRSHTVEADYRLALSERWWLKPLGRFYRQGAARFHRLQLLDGEPLPARMSADYRLAPFKAYTLGLEHGWTFPGETQLVVKGEYYWTRGEPSGALPSQAGLPLYPDLKATVLQLQYRF